MRARGFTLIELVIVMALVLLALVGVGAMARMQRNEAEALAFAERLTRLVVSIKERYARQLNYTGLSAALLVNERLVPVEFQTPAGGITGPWGQIAVAAWDPRGEGTQSAFRVTLLSRTPNEVCSAVINSLADSLITVQRGTTYVWGAANAPQPMTGAGVASTIQTTCTGEHLPGQALFLFVQ